MSQEAKIKQRKSIYIVWIIPLVAMIIAGMMIFKHYDSKGYDIVVEFNNGSGMTVGKTPLIYNGIKIGQVSGMSINKKDLRKVDVTITVNKKAVGVNRKGNVFWKVEPTVSLTEVTGLSTILGGVYISVMPSTSDLVKLRTLPDQNMFIADTQSPINIFAPGLLLKLHSASSDIQEGAPVLYKKLTIGKILDVSLVGDNIEYLIHIDKEYAHLVKDSSQFWEMSGIEVSASLTGIQVKMDSLASVIAGGIGLSSPQNGKVIKANYKNYELFTDFKELGLNHELITLVSQNGYNIDIQNAHIYFKGVQAGDVVSFEYNPKKDHSVFKIKLKKEFEHLANVNAHFWIIEPKIGLTTIEGLSAIARGPYIALSTSSSSKKMKKRFYLGTKAPLIRGAHFKLRAEQSFDLKSGVNVIYKGIVIGSLVDSKLSKNDKNIEFNLVVADKYKHLVNDSSNFHLQGSLEMSASFEGLYLNIGSLASIVNGGIVLETKNLKAPSHKKDFVLYKSNKAYSAATYIQDGGKILILNAESLGSVDVNSPVLYKGLKVGKVLSYVLNKKTQKVEIKIYIKKEYISELNISTQFFNISGIEVQASLSGVKIKTGSLESMIKGGISFKTPFKDKKIKANAFFNLYKDEDAVDEKFIEISFFLKEDSNLKAGGNIIYKSIHIGQVKDLKLVDDEVVVYALIKEEYKDLLVEDSLFWIEDTVISLTAAKNLSSVISGAFIKVLKGHSSKSSRKFSLTSTEPVSTANLEGLRVLVTGVKLSSLEIGSSVFYRQIKIGSVESIALSKNAKGIDIKIFIDKCFTYLVRENSIFYHAGAIGIDVSLLGVKISTETVSTMIKGGITLVTPDNPGIEATDMQGFKLFNNPEEEWLKYSPELINDKTECK